MHMADDSSVVRPAGPRWFRRVVAIAGTVYLAAMFLGSAGSALPEKTLPRSVLYFTQVACLFPRAVTHSIGYRVLGFSCRDRRFTELDERVFFPIRADDKESRFHRLGHFYRGDRRALRALDDYLVDQHNVMIDRGLEPGDGASGRIGGIMLMTFAIPVPEPGTPAERYTRTPLVYVPIQ